jgi:predicted outer membrane protein
MTKKNNHGSVALWEEMIKTKTKLEDLLKKNKDLDPMYVNNKLEEHDELVHHYSILHTKQQMEDSNVELNEWWELA